MKKHLVALVMTSLMAGSAFAAAPTTVIKPHIWKHKSMVMYNPVLF